MANLGNAIGTGLTIGGAAFPPLAAAGLAVNGISAIAQAVRAAKQKKLSNGIDTKRPTLERTKASQEVENRARTMANSTRLPNQAYYENLLGQQTAQTASKAMQTSNSSAEAVAGLTAADRNQREGLSQLAGQGADYRLQSENNLNNALAMKQGEELEMFDYNKNQPYQTNVLRKQALIDSSNRNIEGAFGSLGQGINDTLTASLYNKALNGQKEQAGIADAVEGDDALPDTNSSLGANPAIYGSDFGGLNGNDPGAPKSGGNLFKKAGISKPKPLIKSYNR